MRKKIIIDGKETNYSVTDDAHIYNDITGKELKGTYTTNEYHSIQLVIEGKAKTFMFHRLVAQAFCENPNGYTIVDHIDRNKQNDNASNLRWVSGSTNSLNVGERKYREAQWYDGDFTEKEWRIVYGFPDYMVSEDGEFVKIKTKRLLLMQDRHGYLRVQLNGKYYSSHVKVWESFNEQAVLKGMEIDHIDGNKQNNCLSNLRLSNHSDNMNNAYLNGHLNQIAVKQYDLDGNYIKTFSTCCEAAREYGVYEAAIRSAADRHGTSCGFYWVKENDNSSIHEIMNEWVPEGFTIIPGHSTHCINEKGEVYGKRNKKLVPVHYRPNGAPYINLDGKRINIDKLLP